MKLLLYCTKAKPYLYKTEDTTYPAYPIGYHTDKCLKVKLSNTNELANLNGKIVVECDFEVEEIKWNTTNWVDNFLTTKSMSEKELQKRSCVKGRDLREYFEICYDSINDSVVGYAIHIKNLKIFDKPKELNYCFTENPYKDINEIFTDEVMIDGKWYRPVNKAPQNMMRVKRVLQEDGILISIRPEWLCKILNGEKTIEIRKKVLREMIK